MDFITVTDTEENGGIRLNPQCRMHEDVLKGNSCTLILLCILGLVVDIAYGDSSFFVVYRVELAISETGYRIIELYLVIS